MKITDFLAEKRMPLQALASFISNIHIKNFLTAEIYTGKGKFACLPGLNCYSCPAASGSCPIGAVQAVIGSSKYNFSYYVFGILILLSVTFARFICGFMCPFGLFQELLYKIPTKKFSSKKFKPLRYLKYVILLFMVILLPMLVRNEFGMSDPFFCKYLCPQGVMEGAIPLAIVNPSIRAAFGKLFGLKFTILLITIITSVLFFRPFCKWICPLGAFYALFNKISIFNMKFDEDRCIACGKCEKACLMDIDVREDANQAECIRCGMCIKACPVDALNYNCDIIKYRKEKLSKEKI
jgi:ferredoxin-type protein NapH